MGDRRVRHPAGRAHRRARPVGPNGFDGTLDERLHRPPEARPADRRAARGQLPAGPGTTSGTPWSASTAGSAARSTSRSPGEPDGPRLRHHREPRRPLRPAGDLRPRRGHGRAASSPTPGTPDYGARVGLLPRDGEADDVTLVRRRRPATSSTPSTRTRTTTAGSWSTSCATRGCSTGTVGARTRARPGSTAGPSTRRRHRGQGGDPRRHQRRVPPARRAPSSGRRHRYGYAMAGRRAVRPQRRGEVRPADAAPPSASTSGRVA